MQRKLQLKVPGRLPCPRRGRRRLFLLIQVPMTLGHHCLLIVSSKLSTALVTVVQAASSAGSILAGRGDAPTRSRSSAFFGVARKPSAARPAFAVRRRLAGEKAKLKFLGRRYFVSERFRLLESQHLRHSDSDGR